jgi:hypothetical protein
MWEAFRQPLRAAASDDYFDPARLARGHDEEPMSGAP